MKEPTFNQEAYKDLYLSSGLWLLITGLKYSHIQVSSLSDHKKVVIGLFERAIKDWKLKYASDVTMGAQTNDVESTDADKALFGQCLYDFGVLIDSLQHIEDAEVALKGSESRKGYYFSFI